MDQKLKKVVAELNKRLLENYGQDRVFFEKLKNIQRDLGLVFDDRPTCPFLRPHFVSRELYTKISQAAEHIAEAARRLADAALQSPDILRVLDLTERELLLARINPGYDKLCVTSRLDTFVGDESFKFLEYNAETPAGVGDQMQLEIVLEQIPEVKEFLSDNRHWKPKPHQRLLQALFKVYREFGGQKSKPNIAIVDWEGVSTESEFHILSDYFESMGFRTLIVDPRELEYNGDTLHAGSFEIDIFYKRVLIHEFLEKFDDLHPLIRAYSDGKVCMANSFRVKLAHKKAFFAILTDENYQGIFTAAQIETIRNHIPWTRKVENGKAIFENQEIDLLDFLRRNRERFLLKPNDDYGGKGITFGWESLETEWETALNSAMNESFVVQERAEITKELFPVYSEAAELHELLVDFDPFLFLNEVEGGLVRLSTSSLVNVTQGGGQSSLIVLED